MSNKCNKMKVHLIFVILFIVLLAVSGYVPLITLSPDQRYIIAKKDNTVPIVILMQCTQQSLEFIQSKCGIVVPRNIGCNDPMKYTLTKVSLCTSDMVEILRNSYDPFSPNYGSFELNDSSNGPYTLKVYLSWYDRTEMWCCVKSLFFFVLKLMTSNSLQLGSGERFETNNLLCKNAATFHKMVKIQKSGE